jgi:hypothetical protein
MGESLYAIDGTGSMKKILTCLFFISVIALNAQSDEDYYSERILRYGDHTYLHSVRSVLFEKSGIPLSDPVIFLNSNETLLLQFDLLEEDIRDFSYRIVHCTSDWHPSALSENEYTEGFFNDNIIDYKHSSGTLQPYWHYSLSFPNAQMKPILSGNYLFIVFELGNPDSLVLTRRFHVVNPITELQTNIHRATSIDLRNSHQEIDFQLFTKGLTINNPYQDIKVAIRQNQHPEFTLSGLKPLFATSEKLDFNLEDGNVMEGGSEYRPLDLRTTRFATMSVDRFATDSSNGQMQAILKPDVRIHTQRYSSSDDLNGRFLVKIYDGRDGMLEADYLQVRFVLKSPAPIEGQSVYLDGIFRNEFSKKDLRMHYIDSTGMYEKTLVLKQGFYNYRYVHTTASGLSTLETEGSHYETRNEYGIFIYWQAPGTRYEQLIGYSKVLAGGF